MRERRSEQNLIVRRRAIDATAPIREAHAPLGDEPQRQRVDLVLDAEHAGGKRFFRVILAHGQSALRDDRSRVHFGDDEVNRRAMDLDAGRERARMGVEALEGGQQGRVNVENSSLPTVDEAGREQPHEAGEADHLGAVGVEFALQREFEGVAILAERDVIDDRGRNTGRSGGGEPLGVRPVGQHQRDFSGKIRGFRGLDQRRHVRAAAGNQNGDASARFMAHGRPSGWRLLVGPIRLPRNARNPERRRRTLASAPGKLHFTCGRLILAESCAGRPDRGPGLNLPNLITIARILLVPIVVWAIAQREMQIAFLLFVAAGASDAVDGFVAKRFNMASELGAHLDPLADKALIVSIYVSLGVTDAIPRWIVILVVSRDILIIGGVMLAWFLGNPMTVRPLLVSKLNTAAQILFACLVLASLGFGFNVDRLQTFLLWTVAALTLISVGFYVREWWRHMNAGGAGA